MTNENPDNVVKLSDRRYALFHPHLRGQLEENVTPYTDEPQKTVNTVENTICYFLIEMVRRGASELGRKVGHKITSQTERAFNE